MPATRGVRRALLAALLAGVALLGAATSVARAEISSSRSALPQAARFDAGANHTCAIAGDGTLRCWGSNQHGQLGYGDTQQRGDDEMPSELPPVDLGPHRAIAVSAGGNHTCAILEDRTVRCWGYNEYGQLGYGDTVPRGDDETPASLPAVNLGPGSRATAISAGALHTCALLADTTVRCWGRGLDGVLGYGGTANIGDNESPATVSSLNFQGQGAVAISAGGTHTCAIVEDRTVRCWGANQAGQLGYSNNLSIGDDETAGTAAGVLLGPRAVAISAGQNHTCAVLATGSVRCWGANQKGQLGLGNTATVGDDEHPLNVPFVDLGGRTAIAVTVGQMHSCVIQDNGTTRCWGMGQFGQLGNASINDIGDNETPGSRPSVFMGSREAVALSSGETHTCASLEDGTMRCWGRNLNGELGRGDAVTIGDNETVGSEPAIETAPAGIAKQAVIAVDGGGSSNCALLADGTVRCWGNNFYGQLGYPGSNHVGAIIRPAWVGPVQLSPTRRAVQLAVAQNHACALLADGTVRCWGRGADGRLGYGSTEHIGDNEHPYTVGPVELGGRAAVQIAAGDEHTCALLDNGGVRCWGEGEQGRLGTGGINDIGDNELPSAVPELVLGGFAVEIAAGASHTCALLEKGQLSCWGFAAYGALGYGNLNSIGDNEYPVVPGAVPFSANGRALHISASYNNTCALASFAVMRCWGQGAFGQLGLSSTSSVGASQTPASAGPVPLGGALAIVPASINAHTCAVLADGRLRCWGHNEKGQLGLGITKAIGDDEPADAVGPIDLGAGRGVLQVTGGSYHTCALLEDGGVRCWGLGSSGELGNGSSATIGDDEPVASLAAIDLFDDPPVPADDEVTVPEDSGPTAVDVLANDTDPDAGPSPAIVMPAPADHGTVQVNGDGTEITYEPDPEYCGPDEFGYGLATGGRATVWVTVACVDDPPVAVDDSATVAEDSGATAIDVLANDTDVDGGAKTIATVGEAEHGSATKLPGGIGLTYQPTAEYCGPDSFTYTLDGGSTATVSVTVSCVDDPPVAVADSATLAEDSGATAIDVLANDTDLDGGPAGSIDSAGPAGHGSVQVAGDGSELSYAPDADFCGNDSFAYTLDGGSTATVSIAVTCVDDPPHAVDDEAEVAEDEPATVIDVLDNDTDVDGGPRSIASVGAAAHGTTARIGGGSGLTYRPDAGYCGPDSFEYTLNGGSTGTVSVTVSCVDDAPAAVNDSVTLAEDSGATTIDVLANDADPDGGPKSIVAKTNGSHGTVQIAADGKSLTYRPDPDYCGSDSFTYTLAPGGSTATVSVTVTCVDDAPRAVDDFATVLQGSSANPIDALANDTDPDGGPRTVVAKSDGSNGAVAIVGGASLAYTPNPGFCGPDSFTYSLNGGSTATVSVTVTCVEGSSSGPPPPTPEAPPPVQQTIVQGGPSGPVVNVTPGVGVVSGRRRPRIAIKGSYAFFTLTCKVKEGDCAGKVQITATIPSLTLGETRNVKLVDGRFRIGAARSVLVRAKLTAKGLESLRKRPNLRGVAGHMRIVDSQNKERGEIDVTLVKRPKASLLGDR